MVTVPDRLFSVPAAVLLKAMLAASAPRAVPELSMLPLTNVKFVTMVPSTPLPAVFWIFIDVNDGLCVLVSDTPSPVVFWMVPPELAAPVPVTVRPAVAPVVLSAIPLAGAAAAVLLPDEMLRNVRPELPIVVFVTRRAVALVELMVFVPVTCRPPVLVLLVAAKPSPLVVEMVRLPLNVID